MDLKKARKDRGWTQQETAKRLGVSQPYLALMEKGTRKLNPKLAWKALRELKLSPTVLPLAELRTKSNPQKLAQQLASLGYPGFAHLRAAHKRNPAEVLMTALAQEDLESRLTEALPWLLLQYSDVDQGWLVQQARSHNLSNRLGFVVNLAKGVAEKRVDRSSCYFALNQLEEKLRQSKLDHEDTLCQKSLSPREREWLHENRPSTAADWHLLTDWRSEQLHYAA